MSTASIYQQATSSLRGASWTAEQLVTDVRREARIADGELTDATILEEATHAIWGEIQEPIVTNQVESGMFLRYADCAPPLTVSFTSRTPTAQDGGLFPIPAHAAASAVRHVEYIPDENQKVPRRLAIVGVEDMGDWFPPGTQSDPLVYYLEGRYVRVLPAPTRGLVRIWYQQRHPTLVLSSVTDGPGVRLIEEVETTVTSTAVTTVLTIGTPISNWPTKVISRDAGDPVATSGTVATSVDVYDAVSGAYVIVDKVRSGSEAAPSILTYTWDDANGLTRPGMYLAASGYASHVLLPLELRKPLAQITAANILRSLGDEAGANSLVGAFERSFSRVVSQMAPRSKGVSQRWVNRNSPLRSRTRRGWW